MKKLFVLLIVVLAFANVHAQRSIGVGALPILKVETVFDSLGFQDKTAFLVNVDYVYKQGYVTVAYNAVNNAVISFAGLFTTSDRTHNAYVVVAKPLKADLVYGGAGYTHSVDRMLAFAEFGGVYNYHVQGLEKSFTPKLTLGVIMPVGFYKYKFKKKSK